MHTNYIKMEVVIPYLSAPPTPKRFGGDYYFSAPTSPSHLSQFYQDFDDFSVSISSPPSASVPFDWEEKPGTPKSPKSNPKYEDHSNDFAFDVSEEKREKTTLLPAEELFQGGKIRLLKPPPYQQLRSPISSIRGAFSPRKKKESDPFGAFSPRKKKESDPCETAAENTKKRTENERGRERVSSLSSRSGRRGARSVSPYRVSKYPWEEEQQQQHQPQQQLQQKTEKTCVISTSAISTPSSSSAKGGYRKWRLKDFFLFRSASEGRASDKDPLRKYTAFFRKHEDVKNCSSFRSVDSSISKRRGHVSAHELHYTVNRAVSEDLKKKTFLPYKQGILGRLAFNPAVHALANGFGFSRK